MLTFLEVLLGVDDAGRPRLPPLVVYAHRHQRRPIIVYSDAMFRRLLPADGQRPLEAALWRDARGRPFSRIGFVAFMPGCRPIVSRLTVPAWVYDLLSQEAFTLIQQVEILAALAAYRTLGERLRDEAVVHFIDNTGALSNLIHGYAYLPDCGRMVNAVHLALARLRCKVWFEWVPSKANIADVPSREEGDDEIFEELAAAGLPHEFDEVELRIPPFASWSAPLTDFAFA